MKPEGGPRLLDRGARGSNAVQRLTAQIFRF